MKLETHKLILSPLGRLELEQTTHTDGRVQNDLIWTHYSQEANLSICARSREINQTPTDLDRLAEQMELAAIQIRVILAEMDPGRRFEAQQAEAFQAGKLEGDL